MSANHIESWGQQQPALAWFRHPGCARWAVPFERLEPGTPKLGRMECVECSRTLPVRPRDEAAA